MEPAVSIDSSSSSLRFFIISFGYTFSTEQDFIVFAYLHFQSRQYHTYRTDIITYRQST